VIYSRAIWVATHKPRNAILGAGMLWTKRPGQWHRRDIPNGITGYIPKCTIKTAGI